MEYRNSRQLKNSLIRQMKANRQSYEPQAAEIASYLLPYRHRISLTDQNRGDRRNKLIYDSTANMAVKTLESGVTAGFSNPTKRWIRGVPSDPGLYEFKKARQWFDHVADVVMSITNGSNYYSTMPTMYGDMAGFGTGVVTTEEIPGRKVIHTRVLPFGTYWIGQDDESNVDTFFREFRMTVRQAYTRFGEAATFSHHVQNLIDRKDWEEWIDIGHLIEPNQNYSETASLDSRRKLFASCWFELGSSSKTGAGGYAGEVSNSDEYLAESGFDSFPVHVGRWTLTEGDVYGIDCPGMTALGDIKSLQIGEKRSWQAIEKYVNPHWVADPALRGQDHGFIPGEITWLSEHDGQKKIRPIYEAPPQIEPLEAKLANVKDRIYDAFHTKTFRMLQMLDDRERTATEFTSRLEEGRALLVPMAGQVVRGVLIPQINRIYQIAVKREMIRPAPPELEGLDFAWEFLGPLAQAQQAATVTPVEQVIAFAGSLVGVDPAIFDKIDTDQAVDIIAAARGAPWDMIRDDDEVAEIRAQRAKKQQAAAALQMVKEGAVAAKNLGAAPMDTDNALSRIAGAR